MSWLARSIANTLKLDEGDGDDQVDDKPNSTDSNSPRGVKEDLSELTKTLSRQFWGVASFLAPPPSDDDHRQPSDLGEDEEKEKEKEKEKEQEEEEEKDEDLIAGIRNDFAEIGGRFKSGFSKLSSNVNVSEITKIASNFLQIGSESAVGITEEVVAFARDIAMHPETWLDFPVPDDHDFDNFDMSDTQQEHALAVERLSPRLAALRIELCPGYMSEGCFWKIYFVLLHPRLSKQDAELLSTPQVLQARAMLSHELHSKAKPTEPVQSEIDGSISKETISSPHEESLSVLSRFNSESAPPKASNVEVNPSTVASQTISAEAVQDELETEKHLVQNTETQVIDKAVIEEEPVYQTKHRYLSDPISKVPDENVEEDADDWLKEESSEMEGTGGTVIHIDDDEDVSFSDLEEDDGEVPISYKKVTSGSDDSSKDPRDWVQLSESSVESVKNIDPVAEKHVRSEQVSARHSNSKESNDWLDVDDIDVM